MKTKISALTLILFFAVQANAQTVSDSVSDAASAITQGWSGSATLGASTASGNTEASSISGDIRLGKAVGRWEHLVFGTVFKGSSSIIVEVEDNTENENEVNPDQPTERRVIKGDNSDRLAFGYQPRYYWRPRTYLFGFLDWETDDPANIDSATRQIVGVGHKFWANETGFFSGELGIGNKLLDPVVGDDIDGAIGYAGLNLVRRFTDTATFSADLRTDFGDENTFVELGLGLAFKLAEGMALKISHFTRNNSDLKDGNNPLASNGDSVTSLNIVFDI